MAKQIEHLSGRVKLRSPSNLDSSRYTYLSLEQAEPNLGVPDSSGALVVSSLDGIRSFTTAPILSGVSFKIGALDSADSASLYALFIKGSPLDGTIDSIGYRRLDGTIFEIDTLDTVTNRGNVTLNSIQIGALVADSATFAGDVTINGGLRVNGTTTTLNSTVLTINDKNIVLADSAPDASSADSAGITIRGANAHIFYKSAADTWNFNKTSVFSNNIEIGNKLFIGTVDSGTSNRTLFLDEITGEVIAGTVGSSDIPNQISLISTNDSQEHYLVFTQLSSGDDSAKTDLDLTYNAGLNRLTLGRLILNQLSNQPDETTILSINDSNEIGFRTLSSLLDSVSEIDTLHTVTTRGDSTDNAITVRKITTTDSAYVGSNLQFAGQFLDGSGRRLVIYDSSGGILWG
jgi:hypothetical protein